MSWKHSAYRILSASNDIKAVSKGKYAKRYMRKKAYKTSGKAIRKLFK